MDRIPTPALQWYSGWLSQLALGAKHSTRRKLHEQIRSRPAGDNFELEPAEPPFDLAFAIRVGALDGRHRELERRAHERIARALVPGGPLFIDGGNPLRRITLT